MNATLRDQYDRYETEYLLEMSARGLTDEARAVLDDILRERGVAGEPVEKARVEVKERVKAEERLADRGTRAIALLIDTWAVAFGVGLLASPLLVVSAGVHSALATLVWLLYFLLKDWIPGGSIGKRMLGIRVVSAQTGKRCTLVQSVIRSVALFVPFEWVFIFGRRRLRFGDMAAGTVVLRRALPEQGHN
mgnify:CR=1 FL=1